MKATALFALAAVLMTMAPAAFADSDRETIIQRTEGGVAVPVTTTTVDNVDPSTTVVRTQSGVVETPTEQQTVIKKKKSKRHLLKLPFVSVF